MNAVRAWIKRLTGVDSKAWLNFTDGLQESAIVLSKESFPGTEPGLVLMPEVSEESAEEVTALARESSGPVLAIVFRRSDLGNGGSWRLMQAGAADVIVIEECPRPVEAVAARLRRITEVEELVNSSLVKQNLIGDSRRWREVIRQAVEVARFSTGSLLVTGESGTGKELVARLVHTLDTRADKGKLVVLDCTTVVPGLSGSEFFGHEKGAFTNAVATREGAFAQAHGGTLFLDEVGELPLALQAELLRVIQERTYKRVGSNHWQQADFRLVCATNRDLRSEGANGNFRLDFFHRIASTCCHLPALRERREDILPLARYFLREEIKGEPDLDFAPDVQELLLTRDYPGNIRELRQLVLRIAGRHTGPGPITAGAVPEEDRAAALDLLARDWRNDEFQNAIRRALAAGAGLQDIKDQTVDAAIEIALRDAVGNNRRAALKLGVTDRALQLRRASRRAGPPPNVLARVTRTTPPAPPTDHETHPPVAQPSL
jgi:transcriptional regulator with GAF, ATPase, and Fis domain